MIQLEADSERALGVRPRVSAIILDRRRRLLPATLLPNHPVRIRDAVARRAAPFIR